MSFADTDAAINEQGVIFGAGLGHNRLAGGVRQFIAGTNHEIIKRITFIQALTVRMADASGTFGPRLINRTSYRPLIFKNRRLIKPGAGGHTGVDFIFYLLGHHTVFG